jgi:hypothetical protein
MSPFPKTLYKYRIWNDRFQKKLLTKNEIYLASADQFNDPFDVTLPFKYKEGDLTPVNLFQKLYLTAKDMHPEYTEQEIHQMCFERQNSGVFDDGQYWRDEYERIKKRLNDEYGILSLARRKDNILMWSHYANSHKGFCVGLDTSLLFDSIQGMLSHVHYSNEFPQLELFGNPTLTMMDLLTTKSRLWNYEKEIRLTKHNASRQVFKLPKETFKEIIIGMNMPKVHSDVIILLVKRRFPKMKIYQSHMNLEKFKIDLIPIL